MNIENAQNSKNISFSDEHLLYKLLQMRLVESELKMTHWLKELFVANTVLSNGKIHKNANTISGMPVGTT